MPSFAFRDYLNPTILVGLLIASQISLAAPPWLHVKSVSASAGQTINIPINFKNDGNVVGVQFELALPIDQIQAVDLTTFGCFTESYLGGCNHLGPPNDDIVRYIALKTSMTPMTNGRLSLLRITLKSNAVNGQYPLTIVPEHTMGANADGDELTLTRFSGTLSISGGTSSATNPASTIPTLFDSSPFVPTTGRATSVSAHRIDSDMEILAGNPEVLAIRLPDNEVILVERRAFEPSRGFVPRIGTNEPLPDPNTLTTEREYFWRGQGEQSDARFTVHRGQVNGSITTATRIFVVDGPLRAVSVLELDPLALPPSDAEVLNTVESTSTAGFVDTTALSAAAATAAPSTISVLVMFTPQARTDAGGQAAIDALIQQSMNNLNAAAADSEISSVTFQLVGSQILNGFTPTGNTAANVRADLRALRLNNTVRAARNSSNADVVVVLLRDVSDGQGGTQLGACGVAFVQNQVCAPGVPGEVCTVGEAYEDFAYSWVSVECANLPQRFSFAHEAGHMMGGEHHPLRGSPVNQASFPWSFGFEDRNNGIATLMWAPFFGDPETPQFVQFSSDSVLINNLPSGVNGVSENAATVFSLAPIVEGFRGPASESVFRDSFETGLP